MELVILNTSFEVVDVIDVFESLIWTERYNKYGDFELYMPYKSEILNYVKHNYYACTQESEHMMIIENKEIKTETETGGHITVSGRSLESILDRRIIWNKTILSGNFQNGIKRLLIENIISPEIADRKIKNFKFIESTDSRITSLKIDAQYTGDNLYEVIQKQCELNNIGFKIILNSNNEFEFSLYAGEDRSYDQETNPYVIFSKDYSNILNTNYIESIKKMKNVTLVAGEDRNEGESVRKTTIVGSGSDLNRRELFTDARDVQSENSDGTKLSDTEYYSQLQQRGSEKLLENTFEQSFDGELDSKMNFTYGKDYFKGDVVQVENDFGINSKARITEFIRSQDTDGLTMYPSFSIIQ